MTRFGATRRAAWQRVCRLLALVGCVALEPGLAVAAPERRPCLLELFTSQGCSSCPPADRMIAELKGAGAADVVLSFATDTWDFGGWKDTLASPIFTARQKAYAAGHKNGRVYTPQMVVDGVVDAIGSDKIGIDKAMADAGRKSEVMAIGLHLIDDGHHLRVELPAGSLGPADVVLFRVQPTQTVAIDHGENAGRKITYTNVVRSMTKLATWDGTAQTIDVPELRGDGEGYVVILQKGGLERPGIVLAAAKTAGL
jgi:hypothetical protein